MSLRYIKNRILSVLFMSSIILILVGCGSSSPVDSSDASVISIEKYNAVVDERDYYKEQYEKLIGNQQNGGDGISDNADNNGNTSNDGNTQMIVDVTPENFSDYFEFVLVDTETTDSFLNEKLYAYVPKSKVFDDGWVYVDVSRDFELKCTICQKQIDEGWGETRETRIERLNMYPRESDNPEFNLIDVKGQIMFERMESLQQYEIDTFKLKRYVRTSDGKGGSTDLLRAQLDIQY